MTVQQPRSVLVSHALHTEEYLMCGLPHLVKIGTVI